MVNNKMDLQSSDTRKYEFGVGGEQPPPMDLNNYYIELAFKISHSHQLDFRSKKLVDAQHVTFEIGGILRCDENRSALCNYRKMFSHLYTVGYGINFKRDKT